MDTSRVEEVTMVTYENGERVFPWPVSWSAVWIGTLSAVALALIIGLVGISVGAQRVGHPFGTWHEVSLIALVFSVFGSFLSFALGGWAAAKVAGFRRSEPAMLHGAIAWLVALPILMGMAALGASAYFGGWYGGLAGTPAWAATAAATASTDPTAAAAARNSALAALTALLIGLIGSVIGGWMGSGEPMTFTHYRTGRSRAASGGW